MIIIPANLETIKTLKDRTISLVFETQELTPDKAGVLFSLINKFGYLAFKPELFDNKQVELIQSLKVDDFDNAKSQSQRMRNIFFRLWQQDNQGYDDPNMYYHFRMEHLNNMLKSEFDK